MRAAVITWPVRTGRGMKSYSTEQIRNVALVGHTGCGKTTLAEALLARSGVLNRPGRVEDASTVCDTEPEEHKRQQSLSLALAAFEWVDADTTFKINLLDTPGTPDSAHEVDAALAVADAVVLVVSGVEGVEARSAQLWRRCEELALPRLVFVTKLDKERADYDRVLAELRASFGPGLAPLELPIGITTSLHGIADVLSEQAFEYDRSGAHSTGSMPAELSGREHAMHDELVEEIVTGDDEQLERYLSGEELTIDELERTLAQEVADCVEFPVLCGSALTGVGVDRLADFICELCPSPAARPGMTVQAGDTAMQISADASRQPLAFVFKTVVDQFIGQLSLFKVLSGTIKTDDHLVNVATGVDERLHGLFVLRGKDQLPVTQLVAGDLGAVAKLASTRTGHTLAPKNLPVRVPPLVVAPPVYGVAVRAKTQADDDKLSSSIHRLQAEDPALVVERNDETHQTILRGAGDLHVAVALERLARKFGVQVVTEDVRVAYRETISAKAEAEGKVKKQSGGHGQYAVANLRVAPLARGSGFAFVDSVVGGAIPRQYIPAVHRGVEEAMVGGGVHGFPVVDVQVECVDGKFHAVDSSEMAFKSAAALGFREAIAKASPVVLEPVSLVTVVVPNGQQGDVLSDLNTRRGRVLGTDQLGHGECEVTAHVPTAELGRYAIDLRSATGGHGRFSAVHDHYDVLPTHLVAVAAASSRASHA